MNAIDTNVLIYSIDAADQTKRRKAMALIESLSFDQTVSPWQVACEISAVLGKMVRAGKLRGDHHQTVRALRSCFPIAVPSLAALDRALAIQSNHGLSTWDSLLLASCAEAGVTVLYSEDLQSQPVIDGVRIVNPFL